ncbi:hypothetical protein Bca4012_011810 [Brassica carinata]
MKLTFTMKLENMPLLLDIDHTSAPSYATKLCRRLRRRCAVVSDEDVSSSPSTPKLFLVQPHPTPPKFLQAKLNEALCLANSLEEQRYGYFESDFFDKELPSYVVVQNLIARSSKPCVDTYFGCGIVENIQCHLNAEDSKEEVEAVFINAFFRNSTTKLGESMGSQY